MRIVRAIASLLILMSIAGPLGWLYGKFKAYDLLGEHDVKAVAPELGSAIGISLYSATLGTLCFLIGVAIHIVIAKRTSVYPRHAWFLILVSSSVAFMLEYPFGTVLGGVMIVMLFTLPIFKRMRTIEPSNLPLPNTPQMNQSNGKC